MALVVHGRNASLVAAVVETGRRRLVGHCEAATAVSVTRCATVGPGVTSEEERMRKRKREISI